MWHDSVICGNSVVINGWLMSHICVTWLLHICDMTPSFVKKASSSLNKSRHTYLWHDFYICVTWLLHTCDMTPSFVERASSSTNDSCHVTHLRDMTSSLGWHVVTCHCHVRDMTTPLWWRVIATHVTWLLHMCDMSSSHTWQNSLMRQKSVVINDWVMSHISVTRHVTHIYDTTPHTCDMTPLYVTHIYEGVMSHICIKESCHTYLWHVTSRISMTRLLIRVTWLLHMRDMTP